jgi:hypothetical protein
MTTTTTSTSTTCEHEFRPGEVNCARCLGHREDCDCPRCASATTTTVCSLTWCTEHSELLGDTVELVQRHAHQTSDDAAPYFVRAEQWDADAPVVYVQDSHGAGLTAAQAREFAAALVLAAQHVEGVAR